HLAGGRVQRGQRGFGVDQLAVDQQPPRHGLRVFLRRHPVSSLVEITFSVSENDTFTMAADIVNPRTGQSTPAGPRRTPCIPRTDESTVLLDRIPHSCELGSRLRSAGEGNPP